VEGGGGHKARPYSSHANAHQRLYVKASQKEQADRMQI
jgi:hypothetical protein